MIGRDHLDCGSVASPYRETEAMLDGSDAIADWAILNALVNTASGATWVSFHHGGGVGMGRSLHAGQVCVADGTELAAQKIERVLTNDPGMGVIRHVDAGYDRAVEVAEERGVRIPMRDDLTSAEPPGGGSARSTHDLDGRWHTARMADPGPLDEAVALMCRGTATRSGSLPRRARPAAALSRGPGRPNDAEDVASAIRERAKHSTSWSTTCARPTSTAPEH